MRICGFYWKTGIPSGNHSNLFVPDEKEGRRSISDDLRSYKESGRGESLFDFRGRGKNSAEDIFDLAFTAHEKVKRDDIKML